MRAAGERCQQGSRFRLGIASTAGLLLRFSEVNQAKSAAAIRVVADLEIIDWDSLEYFLGVWILQALDVVVTRIPGVAVLLF